MPIITDQIHESVKYVRAEEIMTNKVESLTLVDSISNIQKALKTSHHGFPVLNMSGRVVGLISRNFLIIILQKKAFYGSKTKSSYIDPSGNGYLTKNNSIKPLLSPADEDNARSSDKNNELDKTHTDDDHAKPFILESVLDHEIFPINNESSGLHWTDFTVQYLSLDRKLDDYISQICDEN